MNKCDCYHIESKHKYTYHPITREPIKHNTTVGVCWGTSEIDECNCGGDKTKCDFYSEIKEKAKGRDKVNIEDCLVIGVDINEKENPTILVTRIVDDFRFKVVNQLWDDEAIEIYNKLIGK